MLLLLKNCVLLLQFDEKFWRAVLPPWTRAKMVSLDVNKNARHVKPDLFTKLFSTKKFLSILQTGSL